MRKSGHLNDLLRYQEQLKATLQLTDNLILQNRPQDLENLQELISQQQQMLKYLQIESSKLTPEARSIYESGINRFRRKIATHRQYVHTNYGNSPLKRINPTQYNFMQNQRHNFQLLDNKITMYENQKLQYNTGQQFERQGQVIQRNIETNRRIQSSVDESQTYINFIYRSVMKRKIMFISLIVFFGIAVVIVALVKIKKHSGQ